jgi:hypothetical protein
MDLIDLQADEVQPDEPSPPNSSLPNPQSYAQSAQLFDQHQAATPSCKKSGKKIL